MPGVSALTVALFRFEETAFCLLISISLLSILTGLGSTFMSLLAISVRFFKDLSDDLQSFAIQTYCLYRFGIYQDVGAVSPFNHFHWISSELFTAGNSNLTLLPFRFGLELFCLLVTLQKFAGARTPSLRVQI